MPTCTFQVKHIVCGNYVYQAIWDASNNEELLCARETENLFTTAIPGVVHSQLWKNACIPTPRVTATLKPSQVLEA